jgi:hypothetical protein
VDANTVFIGDFLAADYVEQLGESIDDVIRGVSISPARTVSKRMRDEV